MTGDNGQIFASRLVLTDGKKGKVDCECVCINELETVK